MLRYFLADVLFRSTPAGKIFLALETMVRAHRLFVFGEAVKKHSENEDLGLNQAEERYHQELHGGAERFFPFELQLSGFPEHMDKVVGEDFSGQFVFKISEWNELIHWFEVLFHNAVEEKKYRVGRDGRWLLRVGRERWRNERWRKAAFENVSGNPQLLTLFPGMLSQTGP